MFLSAFLLPSAPLSAEWAKTLGAQSTWVSKTSWRWKRKLCLFGQNHHFLKVHSPQLLNRSPRRTSECGSQRVSMTPGVTVGRPCIWSCLFSGSHATHRAPIFAIHPMEHAKEKFPFSAVCLSWADRISFAISWGCLQRTEWNTWITFETFLFLIIKLEMSVSSCFSFSPVVVKYTQQKWPF